MDAEMLPVEAIQERDIDLLLLEELNVSKTFTLWFVEQLALPSLTAHQGAWKSISDFGLGETDILLQYQSNDHSIMVLIENKLDATFQDNQYGRYQERAEQYIKKEHCNEAFCVLLAPEFYCENQSEFEQYITYESINQWFKKIGSKRLLFKGKLLQIAAEKLRRGYTPVNSEPVQKFWINYWAFKEKYLPEFRMNKPGIVPHNSDWPEMRDPRLDGIIFYHKLSKGFVDATFCNYPISAEHQVQELVPARAKFVKHNKRFSVRLSTDKVDRTKEFSTQLEGVRQGLKKVKTLQQWILNNTLSIEA